MVWNNEMKGIFIAMWEFLVFVFSFINSAALTAFLNPPVPSPKSQSWRQMSFFFTREKPPLLAVQVNDKNFEFEFYRKKKY